MFGSTVALNRPAKIEDARYASRFCRSRSEFRDVQHRLVVGKNYKKCTAAKVYGTVQWKLPTLVSSPQRVTISRRTRGSKRMHRSSLLSTSEDFVGHGA